MVGIDRDGFSRDRTLRLSRYRTGASMVSGKVGKWDVRHRSHLYLYSRAHVDRCSPVVVVNKTVDRKADEVELY